ncbi:hypothetical protein [Nannocystis pusilla]|uniref:hypothetical protein n=1 Tax=Nannocystis pusilla TaxID=889268 RepID=UPI003B83778A
MAEVLELPQGTVRSRLRRGRELLREIIDDLAAKPECGRRLSATSTSGWLRSRGDRPPTSRSSRRTRGSSTPPDADDP